MLVQTPSTHINIRSVTLQRNLSALSPQTALYAGITARSAIIDVYMQASSFFFSLSPYLKGGPEAQQYIYNCLAGSQNLRIVYSLLNITA